jgi:cell division protein FtsI (penicillin-binding protein 3)
MVRETNLKQKGHQIRMLIALGACFAAFGAIGYQMHTLQIRKAEQLGSRAVRQHRGLLRLRPERGTIFDRNLYPLALNSNRPSLRVKADPWIEPCTAEPLLVEALGITEEMLEYRLKVARQRFQNSEGNLRSTILFYNLKKEQQENIEQLNIPGVFFSPGTGRCYPNGALAASTLGFTGLEGYGLEGLERACEPFLKGSEGNVTTIRDGRGKNLYWTDVTRKNSTRGADVILTIDQYIQHLAENELDRVVEKHQPQWASIVVMAPQTGEILAIANRPHYDPNHIEFSTAAGRKNYAAVEAFEPGSPMKTFTLAAAIEAGVVSAETIIDCEKGSYRVHRHTIRDDIHSFDLLTVEEVLAFSSNIGTVKVAQMLGQQELHQSLRRMGFGQVTGVAFPGESPGLLRPVQQWSGLSIAAIPFGQEMQATTLGLANAYCMIANGGLLSVPKLIDGYRNPRTGEIRPYSSPAQRRVLSEDTCRIMRQMLVKVTEEGGGDNARVEGFEVAGKTGTAQVYDPEIGRYSREKYTSSFIGMVPAHQPQLVIAVVLHQPQGAKYGNKVAGPVFSRIATDSLQYMKVFPTRPDIRMQIAESLFSQETSPAAAAAAPVAAATQVQAARTLVVGKTMREAYTQLKGHGIAFHFEGSGIALKQNPRSTGGLRKQIDQPVEVRFFPPARLN